jgi:transcriptional regulator with XRE-family HTH domain
MVSGINVGFPRMSAEDRTEAEELGRRIKSARSYSGTTQADLADTLGLDRGTVIRWERGEIDRDYKLETFRRAAEKATRMPEEFFVIDFDDLPNMHRAWTQVSRLPDPDELQSLVDERLRRGPKPR